MSRKRYTSDQIIRMLRKSEVILGQGNSVSKMCRELGVSDATYYKWRKDYGGMSISQAQRLKELEKENGHLKRAIAELTLDKLILKDAVAGK